MDYYTVGYFSKKVDALLFVSVYTCRWLCCSQLQDHYFVLGKLNEIELLENLWSIRQLHVSRKNFSKHVGERPEQQCKNRLPDDVQVFAEIRNAFAILEIRSVPMIVFGSFKSSFYKNEASLS